MDAEDGYRIVPRIGIVAAALATALLVVVQGAAQILDRRAPGAAIAAAPWFAAAHGRRAEIAFAAHDKSLAAHEAMAALRRDATIVAAVLTLAQVDDDARTSPLLALALRITRRNLATHMVLLERAASAGRVHEAFQHYSQALRTDKRSWPLLIPPLAQAAADPAVIEPIANELAKQPQWLFFFYREWAEKSPDLTSMVMLSQEMDRRRKPLNRDIRVGLLTRLIAAQEWGLLRDELSRSRPVCGMDACLDGRFQRYGLLQPVDWSPASADKALVVRTPASDGGGYTVEYAFNGPGETLIVRRLMLLPSGDYAFTDNLRAGNTASTGKVSLALNCADTPGTNLSDATQSDGTKQYTRVRVSANCPAQWLTLRMTSDDNQPVSGRIGQLRIAFSLSGGR